MFCFRRRAGAITAQQGGSPLGQDALSAVAMNGMAEAGRRLLRAAAISLSVTYLWWNIAWLAQCSVPPAIFRCLTGLPAPTTGGMRSIQALCRGDWLESLQWNPMAVPLALLLAASGASVVTGWLQHRRARLPTTLFRAWCVCLLAAWLLQLANPRFN